LPENVPKKKYAGVKQKCLKRPIHKDFRALLKKHNPFLENVTF